MRILASLALTTALAASAQAQTKPSYSGHGATSVAPEVLARFAPRPLPAEVSRHIENMFDVRAPGSGNLSPDGKSLYFGWTVTGNNQVWLASGPKAFPVQLSGGEDATTVADITPDGKHLVLQRDRKGEENPGLYLMAPSGGALELIQHKPSVQTFYEFTSDDSRYVYYRANDVKADSFVVYRYDIGSKKSEVVFDQPGLWNVSDYQRDGKLLLRKATGSLTTEYWEWDTANKKLTPLFGQDEKEEYHAQYSAHAGELLVLTPKLGDFRRLYRWQAGKLTPITPEFKADVESFSVDHVRQHVYYMINDGGFARAHVLDAQRFTEIKLPAFAGADHVLMRAANDSGRWAVVTVDSARSPRRSYVFDWKTRKLTEWVVPSTPEVDTNRFAVAKLETYPARDGTRIPMLVRRPAGCEPDAAKAPCPVVVQFHGGPEAQARPGFAGAGQLFVDAGFVFVEPNVRGSEGYGKAWSHADDGPKRLGVITDIEDAARYIRTAWAKDGRAPKIGISGGSYGGYSTLIGMTMFAGAYDAGASVVGIANLNTFLNNTAPYRRALRASEYGDPQKDKEALTKLSPMTYIDRVKAPLLIIQGASDPRVPVGEALQMYDALTARKLPTKLIIFPDEGHGAQKRGNRVIQVGETIAFFEQHLKDHPVASR